MKNPTINDIIQTIEAAEIAYNDGIINNYSYDRRTNKLSIEMPPILDAANININVFSYYDEKDK